MQHATKERFKAIPAVHLFLLRNDAILLLRRYNTGWEDGKYSVPAGHVDGKEKISDAMMREAKEEIGVTVKANDLQFVHVMYRKQANQERIDFFFTATQWQGEVKNNEPHKCDDLRWFTIGKLPQNTIPYVRSAIEGYRNRIFFFEFGW